MKCTFCKRANAEPFYFFRGERHTAVAYCKYCASFNASAMHRRVSTGLFVQITKDEAELLEVKSRL